MKQLLFFSLLILLSCKALGDSSDPIAFYKCLLIDSDIVFNQINSFVEAIKTLDPIKITTTFTTMLPVIIAEVKRCEKETKNNYINEVTSKILNNKKLMEFLQALIKFIANFRK